MSGWEDLLAAMLDAGWIITASWPIDTENAGRMRARNSAVLASSVHLVCRPDEYIRAHETRNPEAYGPDASEPPRSTDTDAGPLFGSTLGTEAPRAGESKAWHLSGIPLERGTRASEVDELLHEGAIPFRNDRWHETHCHRRRDTNGRRVQGQSRRNTSGAPGAWSVRSGSNDRPRFVTVRLCANAESLRALERPYLCSLNASGGGTRIAARKQHEPFGEDSPLYNCFRRLWMCRNSSKFSGVPGRDLQFTKIQVERDIVSRAFLLRLLCRVREQLLPLYSQPRGNGLNHVKTGIRSKVRILKF